MHANEISFPYERMSTKTRFEETLKVIRKWPIPYCKTFLDSAVNRHVASFDTSVICHVFMLYAYTNTASYGSQYSRSS